MEMLVVIALITLLIALLQPALGRAKEQARRTQCMTNTRSQSQAFTMYADDHDGLLPTADQTTHWNLDALYVMDKYVGHALNKYGLATNPMDGSTPAGVVATAWHCPSLSGNPRLYIYNHSSGVLHVDQYMILTGLAAQGSHPFSRLAHATPFRINDPVGVVTAEHTGVYTSSPAWFSNHYGPAGTPDGHNQSYTDGHARWVNAGEFDLTSVGGNNVPVDLWNSGWPWWWSWVNE